MNPAIRDAAWASNLQNLVEAAIEDRDKGTTFLGDFTSYAIVDLDYFGFELAILFVLQLGFFIVLMGRMNGRLLRLT